MNQHTRKTKSFMHCPEKPVLELRERVEFENTLLRNGILPTNKHANISINQFENILISNGVLSVSIENNLAREFDMSQAYACNPCDQTFTDFVTLKKHMLTHNEDPSILSCNQCRQTFKDNFNMERHIALHSDLNSTYSGNTDSGVNCEDEEEQNMSNRLRNKVVKNLRDIPSVKEGWENSTSSDNDFLNMVMEGSYCSNTLLDLEVEQLLYWERRMGGEGNIFTSTPVEGEVNGLQSLEDLLQECKEADSTLGRALVRSRRGRARRWLGRLGDRLLEGVAVILAALL